jgi:hypothetical protein
VVANIFGRHVSGLRAWLIWAFVHLMYIVQFRSRITASEPRPSSARDLGRGATFQFILPLPGA